jgi:hypothetical protein
MTQRTDKELLELAAKAAGLDGYEYVEATEFTYASMQRRNAGGAEDGFFELQADVWSPLTDDGDAFRLAVKLKMRVAVDTGFSSAKVFMEIQTAFGSDPYAATRRAIVRAAAEIGAKV